jgi:flagellin
MKLLNGTMENKAIVTPDASGTVIKGSIYDSKFQFQINSSNVVKEGAYTLAGFSTAGQKELNYASGVAGSILSGITFQSATSITGGGNGLGAQFGEYRLDISSNIHGTYDLTLTGPDGKYETLKAQGAAVKAEFKQLGVTIDFQTNTANSITGDGTVSFTNYLGGGTQSILTLTGDNGTNVSITIGTKDSTFQTYTGQTIDMGGIQFKLTQGLFTTNATTVAVNVVDNSIKLHIGANEGQNMNISVLDTSAKALRVNKVDLQTQEKADAAITTIDEAINRVSSERSKMGAIINRLDHTITNLGTTSENMQASESRIRDVDMAKEIMEFTKSQILSQASQAMLAQANMIPQGVLNLLQ